MYVHMTYCLHHYDVIILYSAPTYLEPLINGVLHFNESLLPGFDANFKRLNEGGTPHGLCLNNLIVKIGLYLIN